MRRYHFVMVFTDNGRRENWLFANSNADAIIKLATTYSACDIQSITITGVSD